MNVTLGYFPEWRELMAAKLTPETPEADEEIQDDDPEPYRHDERLDFTPLGPKHQSFHQVILACISDDERYHLELRVEENDGEVVYSRPVEELKEQTIVLNSSDFKPVDVEVKPGVEITVEIVELDEA